MFNTRPAGFFSLTLTTKKGKMTKQEAKQTILKLSQEYNRECFFEKDPILFPKHFAKLLKGESGLFPNKSRGSIVLQDVEVAGIISAHLAWGRRDLILRDCKRAFDEMEWSPYMYIMGEKYRSEECSLHRTVKWSEFATICRNLKKYYTHHLSLEPLTAEQIRVDILGQKSNTKAANKKIHMFRRWMVRNDGIVDLGLWRNTSPASLIIPLDVHVHRSAIKMGITNRKSADFVTAQEITDFLKTLFPQDPCRGDFALFAYAAMQKEPAKERK